MDPKILELIDRINASQRSALAIADLLSCSDGRSLLDDTLSDIGSTLVRSIQEALATSAGLYDYIRHTFKEPPE